MRTLASAQPASVTAIGGAAARLGKAVGRVLSTIMHWAGEALERSRQRDALAKLDDRQLKDIGLMRWQVEQEDVQQVINKWIWPS